MGAKVGFEGILYYSANGIGGTPAWTEIENARDVSVDMGAGEADVSSRKGKGSKQYLQALKDPTIEFELTYDNSDTAFAALRDAHFDRTVIGVAAMDGPVATIGSQGLWMDVVVIGFGRNEPLEEGMSVPITLRPAYSDNPPIWKTVTV